MSTVSGSRPLDNRERETALRVLHAARVPGIDELVDQIHRAQVRGGVLTFLELEVPQTAARSTCPDGPVPVRALVTRQDGEPTGEILLWVADGYLSGFEFAWFTDDAPTEWPSPEQVQTEPT